MHFDSHVYPLPTQAVRGMRRTSGTHHPETLASASRLVGLLRARGKVSEAEALCRDALGWYFMD